MSESISKRSRRRSSERIMAMQGARTVRCPLQRPPCEGVRRPGVLSRKSRNATYRPAGHKPVMSRSSRSRTGHEPVRPVMWTGVSSEDERTTGPTGQDDRRSGSLHAALLLKAVILGLGPG